MKTDTLFWSFHAHFFLEREMIHIKVVEKIETHFVFNTFFSAEIVPFMR